MQGSSFSLLLAWCALSSSVEAGRVAVLVPAPDGTVGVRSIDVEGVDAPIAPPELQGIQLTGIDDCGRTALFELDTQRARRRNDVPGASRLELPGGRGSLYRFRRTEPAGTKTTGFFLVEPTGNARVLFARTAATPGLGDSTLSSVAVAPDGSAILVATTLAMSGDLHLVDVSSGAERLLTASLPPLEFGWHGLILRQTFGAAVTPQGVLRFDRFGDAPAEAVPFAFAAVPDWFGDAIVASANGAFCTVMAGVGDSEHVYPFVFGATGPARPASTSPSRFAGGGFLPDALNGPYLAVSDDGLRCAWRARLAGTYQSDLVLGTVATSGASPVGELVVTADANFEPYLDEVALFQFRPGGKLLFAAADASAGSGAGLVRMDLFALAPQSNGSVAISNLTLSSTEPAPPFNLLPTHVPERVHWIEEAQAFLVHLPGEQGGVVRRVGQNGQSTTTFHEVSSIDVLERSAGDLLLSLVEAGCSEQEMLRVDPVLSSGSEDVPGPEHGRVRHVAQGPQGELLYVFAAGTQSTLWVVRPGSENPRSVDPRGLPIGPTLGFTELGSAMFTIELGGGQALLACVTPQNLVRRVLHLPAGSCVLPGR